jgi:hypothetical protein
LGEISKRLRDNVDIANIRHGRPQKYRDDAARLGLQAASARDSDARRQMLDIAAQYERLAASLEARNKPTP